MRSSRADRHASRGKAPSTSRSLLSIVFVRPRHAPAGASMGTMGLLLSAAVSATPGRRPGPRCRRRRAIPTTLSGYLSGEFQRLEAVVGQCSDCRGASAVRRCTPDGAAGSGGVGARRGPQRSEPSWSGATAVVVAVYALQELTDRLSIKPSPRRSSGGPDCRRRRAPALPLM